MEAPKAIRLGILLCSLMLAGYWWVSSNALELVFIGRLGPKKRAWAISENIELTVTPVYEIPVDPKLDTPIRDKF